MRVFLVPGDDELVICLMSGRKGVHKLLGSASVPTETWR